MAARLPGESTFLGERRSAAPCCGPKSPLACSGGPSTTSTTPATATTTTPPSTGGPPTSGATRSARGGPRLGPNKLQRSLAVRTPPLAAAEQQQQTPAAIRISPESSRSSPGQGQRRKGAPRGGPSQPGSAIVATQMVKTKLCMDFQTRGCMRSNNCPYAHSADELRALPDLRKTKICAAVLAGKGCKNRACRYAHSDEELRLTCHFAEYRTRVCRFAREQGGRGCLYGSRCPYAHSEKELRMLTEPTRPQTDDSKGTNTSLPQTDTPNILPAVSAETTNGSEIQLQQQQQQRQTSGVAATKQHQQQQQAKGKQQKLQQQQEKVVLHPEEEIEHLQQPLDVTPAAGTGADTPQLPHKIKKPQQQQQRQQQKQQGTVHHPGAFAIRGLRGGPLSTANSIKGTAAPTGGPRFRGLGVHHLQQQLRRLQQQQQQQHQEQQQPLPFPSLCPPGGPLQGNKIGVRGFTSSVNMQQQQGVDTPQHMPRWLQQPLLSPVVAAAAAAGAPPQQVMAGTHRLRGSPFPTPVKEHVGASGVQQGTPGGPTGIDGICTELLLLLRCLIEQQHVVTPPQQQQPPHNTFPDQLQQQHERQQQQQPQQQPQPTHAQQPQQHQGGTPPHWGAPLCGSGDAFDAADVAALRALALGQLKIV